MKRNLVYLIGFLLIGVVSLFPNSSKAGWVIKMKTVVQDEQHRSVLYLQKNSIKVVEETHTVIFKANLREICFINTVDKSFWKGTLKQFRSLMVSIIEDGMVQYTKEMEEQMKDLPPQQRSMMEEALKRIKTQNPNNSTLDVKPKWNIEFERTSDIGTIAGYVARKYLVNIDGKLKEEVWVGEDLIGKDDWDPDLIKEFFSSLNYQELDSHYEYSDDYWEFEKRGFPLKTITYGFDHDVVEVAETIIEKQLSEAEFEPPSHYTSKELLDVINVDNWENAEK